MGLITAWVGYALLKREVQKGYTQVTADVEELFERYLDQDPEPNTLFQIVDGQIVDAVTGEIVGLPQTTDVTEEMEDIARARHDLTTD